MTIEQIQRILREFGDRVENTDSAAATIHRGFSGADVFRLQTAKSEYALRRWPGTGLPRERILGLHRLLAHIARSGCRQVAVPIAANNGQTLTAIDGELWQLEPWKPGAADFHTQPSRERLSAAMRALADWHRAAVTFVPRDAEREWFRSESAATSPAVYERLKKIHRWMEGRIALLQKAIDAEPAGDFAMLARQVVASFQVHGPRVAAELRNLATKNYRLQPCLRDVWHDHILFSGDEVTGIIDPSACRFENVATDLARLLGSLVRDDFAAWNNAVEEYRRWNPFHDSEWELMRTLDRSTVLLSGLFWVDRKFLKRAAFVDEERVLNRLRTIIRRQQALDG